MSSQASQQNLRTQDAQSLLMEIDASIATLRRDSLSVIEEQALSIQQTFSALHRARIPATGLGDLKYALKHWRQQLAAYLVKHSTNATRSQLLQMCRLLTGLRYTLTTAQIRQMTRHPEFGRELSWDDASDDRLVLLVTQGQYHLLQQIAPKDRLPEVLRRCGPQIYVPIPPLEASKWDRKWRQFTELSVYQTGADAVEYRGLRLEPGDILLADMNSDTSGIFTNMTRPKNYVTHAAFFVMLEHDGPCFPAALEIYEHGVRAIPLNVFLSPRFSPYVEVFRLTGERREWRRSLGPAAAALIRTVRGFDLYGRDSGQTYLSCCTVGSRLFERVGVAPIATKSHFLPSVKKNLAHLGMQDVGRLMTPIDYALDPRTRFVGVLDNGLFAKTVTRELVHRELHELFRANELCPDRFPAAYRVYRWGVRQIRKNSRVGRLFRRAVGFTETNFPHGPDELLALMRVAEHGVQAAIRSSYADIDARIAPHRLFLINAFERTPSVSQCIRANTTHLRRWFR